MRTVVVGATGNAGTALLRALARDRPNDSVVGVARRPPETESPFPTKEWVSLDVTAADAADRLRAVMRDADAVVHLAIAFQPMRDRDYLRAVNVDAVRTVATACADAGVPHLVHMSSGGVYA
ncbi:MAG: NAD-dependent epimerase/dehydratase family protein, partial [Rhodococcus sp.]